MIYLIILPASVLTYFLGAALMFRHECRVAEIYSYESYKEKYTDGIVGASFVWPIWMFFIVYTHLRPKIIKLCLPTPKPPPKQIAFGEAQNYRVLPDKKEA